MQNQTTPTPAVTQKFMRPAALCKHLQIAKSTLYLWLANRHDFPRPIKAGARVSLFEVAAVERFLMRASGLSA